MTDAKNGLPSDIEINTAIAALTAFVGLDLMIGPLYLAFGQADSFGRTL